MAHTSHQTFSLSLNSISNLSFPFSHPFRKFFNESYYYLDEASPAAAASAAAATMAPEWELESVGPDGKPTAIPAHLYIQRVAAMHADGDVGFAKEFESVHNMANGSDSGSDESGSLTSSTGSSTVSSGAAAAEASRRAKNRAKNRYPNVVACKKGLNKLNIRMQVMFSPFQLITRGCNFALSLDRRRANMSTPTTSMASRRRGPTSAPKVLCQTPLTPSGGWSGSRRSGWSS